MEGAPADIGDWGLMRIFHEAGRLLWNHFGDFLPVIVAFIIPASVAKVLWSQFFFKSHIIDYSPLSALSQFLFIVGLIVMYEVLEARVYVSEDKIERQTQSFCTSVRLAFTRKKLDSEFAVFLKDKFPTTSEGKMLKAFGASTVCYTLFAMIATSGRMFKPEDIAAMGLPRPKIILFTLLITLITTLISSYLQLAVLVGWCWLCSPRTPILA